MLHNERMTDVPKRAPRPQRVVVAMSCPRTLADKLDAMVRATGRTASDILRAALAAYVGEVQ